MVGRREVTLGGLAALASTRVQAQSTNWPTKPIRLIVPYGPAGPPIRWPASMPRG